MKLDRLNQIELYISEKKVVTIKELCQLFNVSLNTIRRDLKLLKAEGKIETVYGGAKLHNDAESSSEVLKAYSERNVKNSYEKKLVAQAASKLIHDNDTIFIDTGTSTVPLIRHLTPFHHLTVVTNSIYVLYSCLDFPQITTIGLPGILKHKTASLVGDQCERMIDLYHINKAFMACSAFSILNGACNSSPEELSIKKKIMEKSQERYLLLDDSKIDTSSLLTFAMPGDFDQVITDKQPSDKYIQYFKEHAIRLIVAETNR